MIISIENPPTWIQNSTLYQIQRQQDENSQSSDESMNILCDSEYCDFNVIIQSYQDIKRLMKVFNYWDVIEIPYEFYDYIFFKDPRCLLDHSLKDLDHLDIFKQYNRFISDCIHINIEGSNDIDNNKLPSTSVNEELLRDSDVTIIDSTNFIKFSIRHENEKLLQYFHEYKCIPLDSVDYTSSVAELGNVHLLKYLHVHNCPWDIDACNTATRHGHLNCLAYMFENNFSKDECNEYLCHIAAGEGHLLILKYLMEEVDCPWNEMTYDYAAANNRLGILMIDFTEYKVLLFLCTDVIHYLLSLDLYYPTSNAFNEASMNGQLETITLLHDLGYEWNEEACDVAAENGYLNCLTYLHKNGSRISETAVINACSNGHIDCFKYLLENSLDYESNFLGIVAAQSGI